VEWQLLAVHRRPRHAQARRRSVRRAQCRTRSNSARAARSGRLPVEHLLQARAAAESAGSAAIGRPRADRVRRKVCCAQMRWNGLSGSSNTCATATVRLRRCCATSLIT
jgi:hypothetical protein